MTEYNCSERLAIVLKFSYNYDNFNIKKENNMSVNESQIKNTTAGAIDDDDAVIFKERKRLLFLGSAVDFHKIYRHTVLYHCRVRTLKHHRG